MVRSFFKRVRALLNHPVYRQHRGLIFFRAVAWSLHCLLRIPARAKFARWNYTLYLPAKWRGGGCTAPFVFREQYEPELLLLEQFLQPGTVFVDGGANTGVFSFTAASIVGPTGQVLTFEPGGTCFYALEQSRQINGFDQITLSNSALSDRTGMARLYHHLRQENAFTLGVDDSVPFDEVPVITLDDVAKQRNLQRIDFIKLDVEGAEELVLRGARQVVQKWRPVILFEVNLDAARRLKLDPNGACEFLHELGYELFSFQNDHTLAPAGDLPEQVANRFAVPAESPAMRLVRTSHKAARGLGGEFDRTDSEADLVATTNSNAKSDLVAVSS